MYNRIDLYRLLDSIILHWYGHGTQTRYTNKQIKKKGVIYLHLKKNYIQRAESSPLNQTSKAANRKNSTNERGKIIMNIETKTTFTLSEEQVKELKKLQKAMTNYAIESGLPEEETKKLYTLEEVFDFVMLLGQNNMISKQIENAAWYYKKYYD